MSEQQNPAPVAPPVTGGEQPPAPATAAPAASVPVPPVPAPEVPAAPAGPSSLELLAHKSNLPGAPAKHEELFKEYEKLLPTWKALPEGPEKENALRYLKKSLHWAKAAASR